MKTSGTAKHYTDGLITLVVFGVFAACTILALLAGAGVYRRLNARDEAVYSVSTVARYITNKVRSAASPDAVSVAEFGDGSALTVGEELDGKEFVTYIYENRGRVMELFTSGDMEPDPDSGESVMSCDGLEFALENGLLIVRLDVSGETEELLVSVRGRESAG